MSKIDYQKLREIAEKTKIAGEAPVMPFDQRINALNDFMKHFSPDIALALLDEREAKDKVWSAQDNHINQQADRIESLEKKNDELGRSLEAAEKRIAELEAEPVSQAYNLAELIEGMEVSIDVSTCDADLGNRYFGTVTEALELDTAKNGYILLVQDAEPNFDINGNSPVTPDGWVIVPKKLTAENGAKGVLSGEFSETTFISCPECFGDDDCETCDCSGRIEIKVPVSWTTIKTIWAKGCEYFSIVAPQQDG